MPIKRIAGAVLIVAGAILAWRGWEAKQSLGSQLGSMVGSSNMNAMYMLGAGALLVLVGVYLAARP
jgi:drug/metabolite transporter (DMT)-like permease